MKKLGLLTIILVFATVSFGQKSQFTGNWEHWWNKEASKGFVIKLKEKNGRVSGTASGFIPHLYDCEIKSAKIIGNEFTAKIADDWGNSGTVKITIRGNKLSWIVLKSKRKGDWTFPDKMDLKRSK